MQLHLVHSIHLEHQLHLIHSIHLEHRLHLIHSIHLEPQLYLMHSIHLKHQLITLIHSIYLEHLLYIHSIYTVTTNALHTPWTQLQWNPSKATTLDPSIHDPRREVVSGESYLCPATSMYFGQVTEVYDIIMIIIVQWIHEQVHKLWA